MIYDKELKNLESWLLKNSNYYKYSDYTKGLDYSYKSDILKKDVVSLAKSVSRVERELNYHDCISNYELRNWLYNRFGFCDVLESIRIDDAYKHKLTRLKRRINRIINSSYDSFFITFTFDDKHINSSDDSKRQYVRRWLSKYSIDYVGNVDYGGKNGRIHYHAVCSMKDKINHKTWSFGAINFKRIVNRDDVKLSQYVNKLTFHALKESTKRQVLIYKK